VVREIVYYDPVPPELTLLGESSITLEYGKKYEEAGYSAFDNCDGDITSQVRIDGSVNTGKAGTYELTYTVEDSYGNVDTEVRTVKVKTKPQPKVKPQQSEVTPSGKVIYLTFDDGPSAHTEKLLKILKKYNVKATFFVMKTGYTHLLDDIVAQGHAIAAHTYSHDYKKIYASDEAYFKDLNRILDTIKSCTGVATKLIRFPGGSSNTVSRINEGIMSRLTHEVVDRGYRYFDWNVDSNDAGGAKTAEKVYQNVINGVKNRRVSVVLQHDTKSYSVDAVEDIIIWGLENGYTFLPLGTTSPTAAHDVRN
jgi:peptidoglycan/xylan/chitin deacetylase (PgdA/CDA1 family)